jgi:hypothetical protein
MDNTSGSEFVSPLSHETTRDKPETVSCLTAPYRGETETTGGRKKAIRRFDEFRTLNIRKQRRWELRNKKSHRCTNCGSKPLRGRTLCRKCRNKRRVISRRAWAKRYCNPEFRTQYLLKRKLAYWHYRQLGYNARESTQLSGKGIKTDIGPAPPPIPIWREPRNVPVEFGCFDGRWQERYVNTIGALPEGPLPSS